MKNTVIFGLLVIAVIAFLFLLPRKEVPLIPNDQRHAEVTEKEGCLECHGKGRPEHLKEGHPPKFACFKCHRRPES